MTTQLINLALVSFTTSFLILFFLYKSPLRIFFGDKPNYRKVHQVVVPRLGGLGLVLSFLIIEVGLKLNWINSIEVPGFFLSAILFLSIFLLIGGTWDDVHPITYKIKFVFQFFIATLLVTFFDLKFETIHISDASFHLGALGSALSILWIVGVMNAFNIIDGVDGLASGVSMISFVTVGILAAFSGSLNILATCIVLASITSAFLYFNFSPKHKMFLGDTGSLFLGAMVGVLSIMVTKIPNQEYSILVPLMVAGYPLFDITVAMVRRFNMRVKNKNSKLQSRILRMFQADNEHLHHRLVHWGLSHIQTTFLLLMVAATMGSVAIIISKVPVIWQWVVFLYTNVALILILNRLNYIGVKNWIYIPRFNNVNRKVIGVIESDEVFYHSLQHFDQKRLSFLRIPSPLQSTYKNKISGLVVYNSDSEKFQEDWQTSLRGLELYNCPVFVITQKEIIAKITSNEKSFEHICLIKKPVRIPELIEEICMRLSKEKSLNKVLIRRKVLKKSEPEFLGKESLDAQQA